MDTRWDIVLFSGVDWHSHRQRPHWIASVLAERGARVLYVDNLGTRMPRIRDAKRVARRLVRWTRSTRRPAAKVRRGVRLDSPVVLPLQHLGPVRRLGRRTLVRRLRRRLGRRRPLIVWTYLPMPVIADTAEELGADLLVYDWCDDASEHVLSRSTRQRRRIAEWEELMVARADVVFVASAELLRARGSSNPRTYVVPHGEPGRQRPREIPAEIAALSRPRVGYVGSISDWTDLELVERLSRERPSWSFVMVGPVKTRLRGLRRRPNVHFTGQRAHEEIPGFLSSFDVAIIPYRVTPATTAASPVKLREYLAHGLPVVSVDVPEVRSFAPDVEVASDAAQFLNAIERAIGRGHRPVGGARQSWEEQVDEMTRLAGHALHERRRTPPAGDGR